MLVIIVVEGKELKELIRYLAPEYVTPFEVKKDERTVKPTRADELGLISDCWTTLTSESYVTTTCYFISVDWEQGFGYLVITVKLNYRENLLNCDIFKSLHS